MSYVPIVSPVVWLKETQTESRVWIRATCDYGRLEETQTKSRVWIRATFDYSRSVERNADRESRLD